MWHTTRPFFAVPVRVFRPRPDDTSRASGEGRDGSDPPLLTAGAVSRWGGCGTWCGTPTPPGGGRSRPYVSLREGSPARSRAGRSATPRGPMRDATHPRLSRHRRHQCRVRLDVTERVPRGRSRGRVPHGPISHQPDADLVRPNGRQYTGSGRRLPAWPLSPTSTGPAMVVVEVHHPVRAIESPTPNG